jgi:hypothetical protein
MNKKGMLYTLGLTVFMLVFFMLAILFFRHSQDAGRRTIELSLGHNIFDVSDSMQEMFAAAFVEASNISIGMTRKAITIEQVFPADFTKLDNLLSSLKSSVEEDFNQIQITKPVFNDNFEILFKPLNLRYQHLRSEMVIPLNTAGVNYSLNLSVDGNITGCSSNVTAGGSVGFNLVSMGTDGSCNVSQAAVQTLQVGVNFSGQVLEMEIGANGTFFMRNLEGAYSIMTLQFQEASEVATAQLPIKIALNNSAFKFQKVSNVTLTRNSSEY